MEFIPVLMGNDINVYSMARAFHQEYNIKSYVFCKILSGPCQDSDIIAGMNINQKIDTDDVFVREINNFAIKNIDKKVIVIGCGDNYVKVISSNLNKLEKNIIAPYMNFSEIEPLTNKENFYKLCEEYDIPYPKTQVVQFGDEFLLDKSFIPPFIVKPSDSVEYWEYPFENQDKVFFVDSEEEVYDKVNKIFNSGYRNSIIVQEFIPGDDSNMRVLTSFSDENANVKLMALGHVLLEEHTPKGIGNHALILNEYNEEICLKFKSLLEKLNYRGFSNFDIKFDKRDGKYKAFELNPRQGRSNYYVTNSGFNLAKLIIDYFVYKNAEYDFKIVDNDRLWMVVPKGVAFKYVYSEDIKSKMRDLINKGDYVNPLLYDADKNIIRRLRMYKSIFSHFIKFKKYYGVK